MFLSVFFTEMAPGKSEIETGIKHGGFGLFEFQF